MRNPPFMYSAVKFQKKGKGPAEVRGPGKAKKLKLVTAREGETIHTEKLKKGLGHGIEGRRRGWGRNAAGWPEYRGDEHQAYFSNRRRDVSRRELLGMASVGRVNQ